MRASGCANLKASGREGDGTPRGHRARPVSTAQRSTMPRPRPPNRSRDVHPGLTRPARTRSGQRSRPNWLPSTLHKAISFRGQVVTTHPDTPSPSRGPHHRHRACVTTMRASLRAGAKSSPHRSSTAPWPENASSIVQHLAVPRRDPPTSPAPSSTAQPRSTSHTLAPKWSHGRRPSSH